MQDLRSLLGTLDSLDQLELVLILADEPHRLYSPQELLDKTTVRAVDLSEIGRRLSAKGLVRLEGEGWRLTEDAGLAETAAELLRRYREDPSEIVAPLTHGAVERARAMTSQALARAFLLRQQGERSSG